MIQKELGSLFVNCFLSMPALQRAGEISIMSVLVFLRGSAAETACCSSAFDLSVKGSHRIDRMWPLEANRKYESVTSHSNMPSRVRA